MNIQHRLGGFWNKHIGRSSDFKNPEGSQDTGLLSHIERSGARNVAVGAGVGAALGGTLGFVGGLSRLRHDAPTVQMQSYEVTRPVLVGAHYVPESCSTTFTYDGDGNMNGSYETCSGNYVTPLEARQGTGQVYTNREMRHTTSLRNPFLNGAVGMVAGAAVGAFGALLYSVIRDDFEDDPVGGGHSNAPWIGAGVGGALGAAGGFWAGSLAEAKQIDLTHVVQSPVTQRQQIGWVPHLRNFPRGDRDLAYTDNSYQGQQPVYEQVPTGALKSVTTTEHAYRFNRVSGTLMGLGLGAGIGLAAGVAAGLVTRGIEASK